jgi:hypothetical protein
LRGVAGVHVTGLAGDEGGSAESIAA